MGVRRNSHSWFMDNRCSKYITRKTDCFLSLEALQGGYVLFGDRNKGYILGVGKIEKSLNHSIENVYYMSMLKYILLSVSQICDTENEVKFMSDWCTVTSIQSSKIILRTKTCKNIYVVDLNSISKSDLTCISAQCGNVDL